MRLRTYSLLILLVTVLASCSKSVKVPVPSDAAFVVHINLNSFSSKVNWEEIKTLDLFKGDRRDRDEDSTARKIFDKPESSGIDLKSDAFYFIKKHSDGDYQVFTCSIKDKDAFTNFIKETHKNDSIKKKEGLNVIEDNDDLISWNGSRMVMVANKQGIRKPIRNYTDLSSFLDQKKFPQDSLLKFAKAVYNMKESESINSDKRFAELLSQPGELHFWAHSEMMAEDFLAALPVNTVNELFKGNIQTFTLSFDNGKITGDSKSYYNQKLASFYAKNPPKNINEDMLKKIPEGNISAVFAMNYPTPVLKDMLQLTGGDFWANQALSQMDINYTVNDLLNALKGDLFISLSDAKMETETVDLNKTLGWGDGERKKEKFSGKVLLGISLNDPATFDTLLSIARSKMEENGQSFELIAKEFPHKVKDGWFLGGTDSASINNFGKSTIDHPFIRRMAGHPIAGYIDIQKLAGGFKTASANPIQSTIVDETVATWQDIFFYGGEIKDSVSTGHFEINLINKNTNSLTQIFVYVDKITKGINAQMRRLMEESQYRMRDSLQNVQNIDVEKMLKSLGLDSVVIDAKKAKIEGVNP